MEDINEFLPGLISGDLRSLAKDKAKKQRNKNKQEKQQKQSVDAASQLEQCKNCQCHLEPAFCGGNRQLPCCEICRPFFTMCNGDQDAQPSVLDPAARNQKIQKMRQRYEAYLDSIALYPAIKQQFMKEFDDLKTIEEKEILMMAVPE